MNERFRCSFRVSREVLLVVRFEQRPIVGRITLLSAWVKAYKPRRHQEPDTKSGSLTYGWEQGTRDGTPRELAGEDACATRQGCTAENPCEEISIAHFCLRDTNGRRKETMKSGSKKGKKVQPGISQLKPSQKSQPIDFGNFWPFFERFGG